MIPYKRFISIALITFFTITAFTQVPLTNVDSTLYISADSGPIVGWQDIGFDDTSWGVGKGMIGYGDITDEDTLETYIPYTQTLYTRSYFIIDNKANFAEVALICDFDDAFAAYINGVEFARVNLGDFDSTIKYDQLADRSHESEIIMRYSDRVLGYYIDKAFIDSVFVDGLNVLSIEVHNDSVNGSDLILEAYLVDRTNYEYDYSIKNCRYKRSIQLDSTHLPIIKIETNEFGIPVKRIEVPGTIGIIDNESTYNKPGDTYNEHFGSIYIEVRGQSSSHFPKRSYDIELQDADFNDTSISLLGMPRESDWILQGPFADKSQIRNALMYELGLKTGHWTPRIKFCEVIINGEYLGLYNLIEKIKRDSNRIDLARLQTTEVTGNDLTGGYILKYDKPGSTLQIVYPKEHNLQTVQEDYIRDFVTEYNGIIYSNKGLDPELGYKNYIDENSLIDYMIIAEFGKNCDSYLNSSFLYKDRADRDNRLIYGPLWDFDLCFGNAIWQDGYKIDTWQFLFPANNRFHIRRLLEDPNFADKFETRWNELRSGILHADYITHKIDSLTTLLGPAIERNYRVWPIEDKGIFYPAYIVPTYEDEITYVKNWIDDRIAWIDANIGNIYYPITEYASGIDDSFADNSYKANVYPNPFIDELFMDINIPENGELLIELVDIQGRIVSTIANSDVEAGNYKVYWRKDTENINYGLHIISIKLNGKLYEHIKVLHAN